MKFEGQHPDEKVIFILRKHPAVLFRPLLYLTLLTLIPIFAFIYFKFSAPFSYSFFFWLIFGGAYAIIIRYCFLNSQYILTNQRLIDIDQKGIFHKTASEAPLEKIQDVSFEIKGVWPSMWDYGTIYVQTAGAQEKIELECVEEPGKIQEQILEAVKGFNIKEDEEKPKIEKSDNKIKSMEEIKKVSRNKKNFVEESKEKLKNNFWD